MRGQAVSRLIWSSLALGASAVVLTARWLTPSPSGVGTHVALGLSPCGFLLWSGLPCPACGLTTSFAQLAHGELTLALRAHPLGLPLFAFALITPVLALCSVLRGESFAQGVDRLQADRVALALVLSLLCAWAAKLLALSLR